MRRDGDATDLTALTLTRRSNSGTLWADRHPDGVEVVRPALKRGRGAVKSTGVPCTCMIPLTMQRREQQMTVPSCLVCGGTIDREPHPELRDPGLPPLHAAPATTGGISDADLERLARRVAQLLKEAGVA